jgi:hypothetical protein
MALIAGLMSTALAAPPSTPAWFKANPIPASESNWGIGKPVDADLIASASGELHKAFKQ